MKANKFIAITGIILILGVLMFFKFIKKTEPEKEVHYHAGFVVFADGQKLDFSSSEYMYIKPCNVDTKKTDDAKTVQMENAHLHDNIGDVVHVESEDAKWGDLFTNIDYPLDYSNVTAYINGVKVSDIKNAPIKADDSVVIFIGKTDESLLIQAVTIDHIKQVESKSVECGD